MEGSSKSVNSVEENEFKYIEKTFSTQDIRTVYKFVKLVGGGHFGSVRTASLRSDPNKTFAVKSIRREHIRKEVHMLENELNILKEIDHPNIVKFMETYIDYRYVHIVMEHCTGGELFDRVLTLHKFRENEAAALMRKMLSAIKHLHEHGVCHRDLKPENFMFADKSDEAEIKLIDFGLSKKFSSEDAVKNMKTVVGTPFYVAPEVLEGAYDFSCDIWSLGVILYVLLCGYPPFDGESNKEIFTSIREAEVEFDIVDWCSVSKEAKDCVKQMLKKNPKERITIDEIFKHSWYKKWDDHTEVAMDGNALQRLKNFRAPHRLQVETLTWLVSNTENDEIKKLRETFRAIDTENRGVLKF